MKRTWFRFVIILLISLSVVLAFSDSIKPQPTDIWDLDKWQLSIDLDMEKCPQDNQIKIGKNPLFCLKDVSDLPHPDSPDYWQENAEKVSEKAQVFSQNLTNFANTSIPVEDLQISRKVFPVSRECKEKNGQNICEPLRYFSFKKIFYQGRNQYFNKDYKHTLMTIGITPEVGYYVQDPATNILENTLEEKCMDKEVDKKKKCKQNMLKNNSNSLVKESKKQLAKECREKEKQEQCESESGEISKSEEKLKKILEKRKEVQKQLTPKLLNKLVKKIRLQELKIQLEEKCENDNRKDKAKEKCKIKIKKELETIAISKDFEDFKEKMKEKNKEDKEYETYRGIFKYQSIEEQNMEEQKMEEIKKMEEEIENYIRFKIKEYRNDYVLNSSEKTSNDSQQDRDDNEQKLSGLSSQAVKVGGKIIFYIRTWHDGVSPQERAKKVNQKIDKILRNQIDIQGLGIFGEFSEGGNSSKNNDYSSQEKDSSKVIKIISDDPFFTEADKAIIEINKNDAILENQDSTEILAKKRLDKIMQSISEYREKLQQKGYNFSDGLVGDFVKLNDQDIFYIKPNGGEELWNSSFRATKISKKVNRIADKLLFNPNALMVAYLIVEPTQEDQTVCILPESLLFSVGSSEKPSSKEKCKISKLEQKNNPLAIIYSPRIYSQIKKNQSIKVITISDNNVETRNKIINLSWILDKEEEKINNDDDEIKVQDNKQIYEQIMQIRRDDPDLKNFADDNSREKLSIRFIEKLRQEISSYRKKSRISFMSISLFSIIVSWLLWREEKASSYSIKKIIKELNEKYSSNIFLKLLFLLIPLISIIVILIYLLYDFETNPFDFLKKLSPTFWILLALIFIFLSVISLKYDEENQYSKKLLNMFYKAFKYLVPFFFIVNMVDSFVQTDQNIKAIRSTILLFLNQEFNNIGIYIINEFPYILFIIFIAFSVYNFFDFLLLKLPILQKWEYKNKSIPKAIFQIIVCLIIIVAVILIAPYLPGSDTVYFKGISAFMILVFTWSGSSIVGDFVAGLLLIFSRSLQKGSWIKIGEVFGKIEEQDLLVHRIQTPKNTLITIPNAKILKELTTNFSWAENDPKTQLILHTPVGLGYDTPREKVEKTLTQAALNLAKKKEVVKDDPPPFVLLKTLGDFAVTYELNVHIEKVDDIPELYSELHKNIQDECNKAGIEIMSPNYLAIRDGKDPTIPKSLIKTSKS